MIRTKSLNPRNCGAIAALVLLFVIFATPAVAAVRTPDKETVGDGKETYLVAKDPNDRDEELYTSSFAILIGQSNYQSYSKLPSVPDELQKLMGVLESSGFHVLLYNDLDSGDFQDTLQDFFNRKGNDKSGRVFIFYAGHSVTRDVNGTKTGYILPTDAVADVETLEFREKSVRFSQFLEWAEAIEAKHALFVFDSCFSGAILGSRSGGNEKLAQPSNYIFSEAAQSKVRHFITSGTAEQQVPSQSFFLPLLVESLSGQRRKVDVNEDDFVSGRELASFLQGSVPRYVAKQTPQDGFPYNPHLDKGDFAFRLPESGQKVVFWSIEQPGSAGNDSYTPIVRGNPQVPGPKVIVDLYEPEIFVATANHACRGCDTGQRTPYGFKLDMPSDVPESAIFGRARLECIGGQCRGQVDVTEPPALSSDKRSVTAKIETWGSASSWKLSAPVLVPASASGTGTAFIRDTSAQKTLPIEVRDIALVSEQKESVGGPVQPWPNLAQVSLDLKLRLESDDTSVRRTAREDLAAKLNGQDVAELVQTLPAGSYRYQLGIAYALSNVRGGWQSSEMTVSHSILFNAASTAKDETLRKSLLAALANMVPPDGMTSGSTPLTSYDFGDAKIDAGFANELSKW